MAILTGAFLKFAAMPINTVWEGLVSVGILTVLTAVLGVRDARKNRT